jgi:hypothetical protein
MRYNLLKITMCAAAVAIAVAGVCGAATAGDDATSERPAYQGLRYNEDWSFLAAAAAADAPADPFDSIKYISLADGVWLSLGGQVRERLETWHNFGFGAPGNDDDTYLLTRLLYHGDLHIGEIIRVFVQGKSSFSTDRDLPGGRRAALDVDELALQNGFVDVSVLMSGSSTLTLRSGRQEMLLGKQRLVSPLDWANNRRTFDGFSGILDLGEHKVTAFWTRPVEFRKYHHNKSNNDNRFYGLYTTCTPASSNVGYDAYYLGLDRENAMINGSAGREERHTLGARLWGKVPDYAIDYDVEGAYQFGEIGTAGIDAFMLAAEIGGTIVNCPIEPRVHLGLDVASGDDDPGDNEVEMFNQLYPLGHAYLGYIDTIGRQNITDISFGISTKSINNWTFAITDHNFWRTDDDDALYNAGGGVVQAESTSSKRYVGNEIDCTAKYTYDRHLAFLLGYSHFEPGDFIDDSPNDSSIDLAYGQAQYTF